ncbi:ATP-binding protein [Streptomyces cinnamoneus]|uniref:wHTH domain-containing protein n=1 Tax=Streptomyces cinnamoneus TaxID=53446 RepID=UPI00341285D2
MSNATAGIVIQADTVCFGSEPVGAAEDITSADDWVTLALDSPVWQHVPADRGADFFRQRTAETAARLAELRDEAERALAADPWLDGEAVPRFAECVEWLLGEPDPEHDLDLYPAEAALLVLMPFLYRVHGLRLASLAMSVEPHSLRRAEGASAERSSFEVFAEGHDLLVKRALLRPAAAAPIGWWLFHRWLAQHEAFSDPRTVRDLLELVGEPAEALGDVLAVNRICALLHGLRRGADVCNREFLDSLAADERVRVRGRGLQRVRDQRLCLLLALAYGTCREATALPQIVVEHLGIPFPVDLAQLRRTLDRSSWGGTHDLPVLRAECHHEAVIEGLRAYTARADELLTAVRRTVQERVNQPVPPLPARLSADGATPAEGVFSGWAGFRLDERRVRDLLMGVQLYRDRDLAVRELYQNALDACRYRRARTQYLDRTGPATYTFEGRICFEQGEDEEGREYVECRDNGVGMGASELRGVFSNAGSRFVDQLDFKLERAAWDRTEPPVRLHPNSRFGIGVLSYFMLADEIRVTTCRMDPKGELGPLLEVSIFGPGHLFRIVQLAERGDEAGTRVRLYLRDEEGEWGGWSCLDVLERVLGIAEFPTEVRHGERRGRWDAGVLKGRKAPGGERFGLDAHGALVPWPDAPEGAQVVWCEHGGGLLVDGLVVQPETGRGVLSEEGAGLAGAVVNLSGEFAPERLSVERSKVLSDVSGQVGELLRGAADAVAVSDGPLPSYAWICRAADRSMQVGDILAEAVMRAGRELEFGGRRFDSVVPGCFPPDNELLPPGVFKVSGRNDSGQEQTWREVLGKPPEHILLWRILAHGPNAALDALADVCPEVRAVGPVQRAVPSDQLLLAHLGDDLEYWHWDNSMSIRYFRDAAQQLNATVPSVLRRAGGLGADASLIFDEEGRPGHSRPGRDVSDAVRALAVAAKDDPLLMWDPGAEEPQGGVFGPDDVVPPGHVAKASRVFGISVPAVRRKLEGYGLAVDADGLPEWPDEATAVLLSEYADGRFPWLSRSDAVPPGHVVAAARAVQVEPAEALRRLVELGFSPPSSFPVDAETDDLEILSDEDEAYFRHGDPIGYVDLLRFDLRELGGVVARLRAYGFDVPLNIPAELKPVDVELLSDDALWWGVTTHDVMPLAHVIIASRAHNTSLRDLVDVLTGYGLECSRRELPDDLSFADALRLLRVNDLRDAYRGVWSQVDLHDLLRLSHEMGTSITQVASWFRDLGLPVDPAERIRAALKRVPRP